MTKTLSILALSALVALAGCASGPSSQGGSAPAPAAAAEPVRTAAPVSVPAAAARTVVVTMTGPQAVTSSKDWQDLKTEFKDTWGEHAKALGLSYRFVDAAPAPGAEDGTLLTVTVNDYRMVGIGARIMFGVMTGNAYIDANVRYSSLRDGKVFGDKAFNTSSSAWGGIFAKVTPQQVDAIGAEVFADLKAAR